MLFAENKKKTQFKQKQVCKKILLLFSELQHIIELWQCHIYVIMIVVINHLLKRKSYAVKIGTKKAEILCR